MVHGFKFDNSYALDLVKEMVYSPVLAFNHIYMPNLGLKGLILGASLASSPAQALPINYYPYRVRTETVSQSRAMRIAPENHIDDTCALEAEKKYSEIMDVVMSQDFIIGSHMTSALTDAEVSRRDCVAREVTDYCAITGDMKYAEVIRDFGYESDNTVAKAAHIAEAAQALCTDEMKVKLSVL